MVIDLWFVDSDIFGFVSNLISEVWEKVVRTWDSTRLDVWQVKQTQSRMGSLAPITNTRVPVFGLCRGFRRLVRGREVSKRSQPSP